MGRLRTRIVGPVLAAVLFPWTAGAGDLTDAPQDPLHFFASCAGRLSALMEHQWMFDGVGSELTQQQLRAATAVVAAILPPGDGRKALAWRIEAKAAHRALLGSATFSPDPRRAAAARRQADRLVLPCTEMLLG